jgi:hypothetical protein
MVYTVCRLYNTLIYINGIIRLFNLRGNGLLKQKEPSQTGRLPITNQPFTITGVIAAVDRFAGIAVDAHLFVVYTAAGIFTGYSVSFTTRGLVCARNSKNPILFSEVVWISFG